MRALGPALVGPLLALAASGCGAEYATARPDNPGRVADGLVVTRADGSSYELDDAVAVCGRSEVTGTEYVYLTAGSGFALQVVSGVTGERALPLRDRLPVADLAGRMGPVDVAVSVTDPRSGERFTAYGEGASGTLAVTEASCDPEPRLTFRLDARLQTRAGRTETLTGGLATVS